MTTNTATVERGGRVLASAKTLPMTNPQMSEPHASPSIAEMPLSVFEVMGDEALVELRHHAAGLLRACAGTTKLRREAPFVGDDLDLVEGTVSECVRRILVELADAAGMPSEGESLSRGVHTPAHGDYRILANGCKIWLRSLDTKGYPVLGRRTALRHNRPAYLYWMLLNGPIPSDMRLVRTCGEPHCIAPEHGEMVTMAEYGERTMRTRSPLDWDAVHEIRRALPAGEDPDALAERFGVTRHTIGDVFRNVTWRDPDYEPGVTRTCGGCSQEFRTTNLVRRHCSADCVRSALARRQRSRGDCEPTPRQVRDRERLRCELEAATEMYGPMLDREIRTTWGPSLDATLSETRQTLHDMLADPNADDPVAALEAEYAREVLGDLTEDEIPGLDADELLDWQVRLDEAGLNSSTSRAVD